MHRTVTTATRRALGLLACMLLDGCDWPEQDSDASSSRPSEPAPPTAGMICSAALAQSGAHPQANGAFCFGVALTSSDLLRCAQTSSNETQCIDELANLAYVVSWAGSRGTVRTGQGVIGAVEQLQADSYEIELVDTQGGPTLAVGLCTFEMSVGRLIAKFCEYE